MPDIWSWNNAVDASGALVDSNTGSAGDLVTANVRDPRVGKIWRAGGMPVEFSVTLPSSSGVSVFGIFGCNFSALGEITVSLQSGASVVWSETFDPSELGVSRQAVFVIEDDLGLQPVAADTAKISAASGSPMEIGRVWIGGADWQPVRAHTFEGALWGFGDRSNRSQTPRSGSFLIDRGARLRHFTTNYVSLESSEYAGSLFEMDDTGLAQQMLFVPTTSAYDPHKFAVLGYLDEMPSSNWASFMAAGRSITISEAG